MSIHSLHPYDPKREIIVILSNTLHVTLTPFQQSTCLKLRQGNL